MKTLIGIFILIALIVLGGFFISRNGAPSAAADTLPTVSLQDAAGNTTAIQEFQDGDRVLVINSWATWCPFCVQELPDFAALQEEFADDILVIAVNRRESVERSVSYLSDLGVERDLTYLYDASDGWYRAIGGFSMPETLFVSAGGEIVVHKRGFMALDEMRDHVETALAGN
ncbi:MAG: TlpA family protein disulfide reductase [Candidatus Paceibacteria bacterium]